MFKFGGTGFVYTVYVLFLGYMSLKPPLLFALYNVWLHADVAN